MRAPRCARRSRRPTASPRNIVGRLAINYSATGGLGAVHGLLTRSGTCAPTRSCCGAPAGRGAVPVAARDLQGRPRSARLVRAAARAARRAAIFPLSGGAQLVDRGASPRAPSWMPGMTSRELLADGDRSCWSLSAALAFWLVDRALAPFPADRRRAASASSTASWLTAAGAARHGSRTPSARPSTAWRRRWRTTSRPNAKPAKRSTRLEERRELAQLVEQRVEEERRLIAHELHDEFGQSVTAIRRLALAIATQSNEPAMGDGGTPDLRRGGAPLRRHARPHPAPDAAVARHAGTCRDAENLVRDWQRRHPGRRLSLHHELPADLGPSVTLAAYRVGAGGADQRAAPRAGATRRHQPREPLGDGAQRMIVTVTDDGVGLPPEAGRGPATSGCAA